MTWTAASLKEPRPRNEGASANFKLPFAMGIFTRGHAGQQRGKEETEIAKGSPDAPWASLQPGVSLVSLGLGPGDGRQRPPRPKDPQKRRSTVTIPEYRSLLNPLQLASSGPWAGRPSNLPSELTPHKRSRAGPTDGRRKADAP